MQERVTLACARKISTLAVTIPLVILGEILIAINSTTALSFCFL
ncbi:hypothetical protein J2W55_001928 [Mucilaginibacter pocheonensis]|uniref:Uncharacterized protein n=1 Tax=Mucilaginibacter pocheonensis TaxID=398050 RepID=A0ABU1TA23_9SPHI|nr:hypothetical protein [Mucilaginibacter pocheonensis]